MIVQAGHIAWLSISLSITFLRCRIGVCACAGNNRSIRYHVSDIENAIPCTRSVFSIIRDIERSEGPAAAKNTKQYYTDQQDNENYAHDGIRVIRIKKLMKKISTVSSAFLQMRQP